MKLLAHHKMITDFRRQTPLSYFECFRVLKISGWDSKEAQIKARVIYDYKMGYR
jgi:hypothetical protein